MENSDSVMDENIILNTFNLYEIPSCMKRERKDKNICKLLKHRELYQINKKIQNWYESRNNINIHSQYIHLSQDIKSTISVAFSPDGHSFASTHGDHTIKIISFSTGKVLKALFGHPRTPWTVKYNPSNPRFIASGCLGSEIRVWDLSSGETIYKAKLNHAIISLSFHPDGQIIAVASGNGIYLWDYQHSEPRIALISQRTLRCVMFSPNNKQIIIGEANDQYNLQPRPAETDLTVTLTLWEFDISWLSNVLFSRGKCAFSNSRILSSHVVLYNDGGFDISSCGNYLVTCADLGLLSQEKKIKEKNNFKYNNSTNFYDINNINSSLTNNNTNSHKRPYSHTILETNQMNNRRISRVNNNMISTISTNRMENIGLARLDTMSQNDNDNNTNEMDHTNISVDVPRYRSLSIHRNYNNHIISIEQRTNRMSHNTIGNSRSKSLYIRQKENLNGSNRLYDAIAISRNKMTKEDYTIRDGIINNKVNNNRVTWLIMIHINNTVDDINRNRNIQHNNIIKVKPLRNSVLGGITSTKFSPSNSFILVSYGARDRIINNVCIPTNRRVCSIYSWEDDDELSSIDSLNDDVNVAIFHPIPGNGFIYGTKKGQIRIVR